MAVFHLKVSVGSRAGGQSAVAKADYIEREGRYEQDREELEHKEHGNMPEWAEEDPRSEGDPRSYWEAADEHERANGSLFREITFALPKELNEGQRRELASGFAAGVTEGERLPYTLAIHRGGPDGENPHAHLMISERANDGIERSREQWFRRYNAKAPGKGGAKKSRTMMSREWVKDTREAWARAANEALRRAGCGERIDHRSLAERRDEAERSGDLERAAELSRKPNVHLGPQAYRAGDLEREDRGSGGTRRSEAGFWRGPSGWSRTIRRFGRSGTASSSGSRRGSRGSIGSFRRSRRRSGRWESGSRRGRRSRTGSGSMGEGTRGPGPRGPPRSQRNYSHAAGPQISNTPRSPQPTRGHERDVGPSR